MKTKKTLLAIMIQLSLSTVALAGDVEIHLPTASDAMTVDQPAGTELMRVNGDGNVGIGTATPASSLDILGSSASIVTLRDGDSTVNDPGHAAAVHLLDGQGATTGFMGFGTSVEGMSIQNANDDGGIHFSTGGNVNQMTVAADGKVGIGTQTPTATLFSVDLDTSDAGYPAVSGDHVATADGRVASFATGARTIDLGINSADGTAWVQPRNLADYSQNSNFILNPNGGNVGVGTTTPSSELHVADNDGDNVGQLILNGGTSGNGSLKSHTVGGNQLISLGPLGISEALNIRNINGYVGINNTNPQRVLHVTGGVQADNTHGSLVLKRNEGYTAIGHGNGLVGGLSPKDNLLGYFGYTNTTVDPDDPQGRFFIQVDTNNDQVNQTTEHHFNVLHTGNVGIGTITPMHPLEMGSGAHVTAAGVWTNASDISKKENIKEINYGLDTVMKLRPSEYDYKTDNSHSIGFIAQEIEKIVPEVVSGKDGSKGVAYGSLTAVLVKAMQQQQAQIVAQQKRIETLEAKLK